MAISGISLLQEFQTTLTGSTNAAQAAFLRAAIAAIKSYCKLNFEQATYTHYHDGAGQRDLFLLERPVASIISVNVDATGCYGDGPSAFAATTLWTPGTEYSLVRDYGAISRSGRLRRLSGIGSSNAWLNDDWGMGYGRGYLSGRTGPGWPGGSGNIKVVYVAGFLPADIPAEIAMAANEVAKLLYLRRNVAGPVRHERLGEYDYDLMQIPIGSLPELGSVRQMLAPWKEIVV